MRSIRLAQHAAAATLLGAVLLAGCSNAIDQGPGGPTKITSTGATDLSGVVGTTIGPFVFVVTDTNNNVVPGVPVTFTISGAGTLNTTSATTDNGGSVITTVTYSHTVGTATVTATASGIATPASVSTTSMPDAPITITPFNSGQSAAAGTQLIEPLSVSIRDQYGNPVSNVLVAWHADAGVFGTPSARTGADGKVQTTFTLPATAGQHAITATTSFGVANFTATGN